MKKQAAVSMALLAMVTMTGCGDDEASNNASKEENDKPAMADNSTSSDDHDVTTLDHDPTEPDHDEVCAFCNMKIYGSGDPMGAFTAQAITAEGERVFFDDSGCLLNAERKAEKKFVQSWVRDLETMDWKLDDEVVIVKADIQTPMKYGYAFFSEQEAADKYVSENADLNATITDWTAVDEVAYERYKKKMEKMKQSSHDSTHSDTDSEGSESGH